MRAITLTQPWASAIAHGIKQWETRSWPTGFRGEIAIHAAKGLPKSAREFANEMSTFAYPELDELPLGYIVALAELTECRMTDVMVKALFQQRLERELKWGDYEPGRYAFKLENVRRLKEPIFHRGSLGIWVVNADEERRVLSQF